jgi:hypothetical protein
MGRFLHWPGTAFGSTTAISIAPMMVPLNGATGEGGGAPVESTGSNTNSLHTPSDVPADRNTPCDGVLCAGSELVLYVGLTHK